jgi:serine protease inhibitor
VLVRDYDTCFYDNGTWRDEYKKKEVTSKVWTTTQKQQKQNKI